MRAASPQALLNAAIFFDFRALHGEAALATELRSWLHGAVSAQKLFLRHMTGNALQVRPPLGVLRDFVDVDDAHPGTMDLKKYAARPFIDAARILALANGVMATNTAERLRGAMRQLQVADEEVGAYVDAFHFVQLLRLRNADSPSASTRDQSNGNRVVLETLNELDRRILKESLRQARKLQARLEMDFRF